MGLTGPVVGLLLSAGLFGMADGIAVPGAVG